MQRVGTLLDARSPVTDARRRHVVRSMYAEEERFRPWVWRFATLMALSVSLAALGLIADSPAVIIGAMVVAPPSAISTVSVDSGAGAVPGGLVTIGATQGAQRARSPRA